jgi:hypothetical protein
MPTNILRRAAKPPPAEAGGGKVSRDGVPRLIVIRAGTVTLRARLLETQTADRIWRALPLRSTAEIWGEEVFFKTPVESGRERGARVIVKPGEIAFSPDRDVIAIAWGRTPTSKQGELRLWSPSNVWAEALDDVRQLGRVRPGERVEVTAVKVSPDALAPAPARR